MKAVLLLAIPLSVASSGDLPDARVPSGWRAGILIVDAETGDTLLDSNAEELFRPASTMKIATTILALRTLGPGYVYRTPLLADTAGGVIYIRGSGAPLLSTEDVVRVSLESSAALCGFPDRSWDLVYDLSVFDEEERCPGWDALDWSRAYCPPISAICVGDNLLEIVLSTMRPGSIDALVYPPLRDIVVDNRVVRGDETRILTSVTGWESGLPVITLEGTMKPYSVEVLYRPFPGPQLELVLWLAEQLEDSGVRIGSIGSGAVPTDTAVARPVATMYSEPMQTLLTSMNKWSRNMIAEQIMKTVSAETQGYPGSTGAACDMIGWMIDSLAGGGPGPVIADGSGLSRNNLLAPVHLCALLDAGCHSMEWGPEFLASLPVNGRDGTLMTRMEQIPEGCFRGKTGTLGDTCVIAGILTARSGKPLYVVIMLEIPRGHVFRARDWQDCFIEDLYGAV